MPGKRKGINKGVKKRKYPSPKSGKATKNVSSTKPPKRRVTY